MFEHDILQIIIRILQKVSPALDFFFTLYEGCENDNIYFQLL